MNFVRSLITDLRERQVLPAVLLLVVLVIAIPVVGSMLYSKVPAVSPVLPAPVAVTPPHGMPPPATELANVQTPPTYHSHTFTGAEPNPLVALRGSTAKTGPASTPSSSSSKPTTKSTVPPVTPPVAPGTVSGSGPPTGSSGSSGSGKTRSHSAPSSLSGDEAYTVNVATSYGSQSGTVENIERLTPLPPNVLAEVVFLGVMKGGKSAAFLLTDAIAATAKVSGPVTCVPSTSDCEVVELPVGSVLTVTPGSASSGVSTFTLKVNAIGVQTLASKAAASQARQAAAAAGQAIITASTSPVLAGFFYNDAIGALVYQAQPGSGTSGSTGTTGASGSSGSSGASGTSG